jgi:hypothetical protein
MAFWQWKTSAALNASADPSINMAEGMPPAQLNDGVRALMARAAENRDDTSGLLLTAGTSTAYTVTTNQGLSATPNDGQLIVVSFHTASGAVPTLAADGGTAFPIQVSPGVAVSSAGGLFANVPVPLKFRAASSAWELVGAGISSFALAVAAGAVTNAMLANAPAWTLKGNNTSASAAPQDFTIDALTVKAAPLAADEVPIWDVAGAAMKKATLTSLVPALSSALPTVQSFGSGSGTYTPTAGTLKIRVRMCAGGGGGGGAGAGNGGGGGNTTFGGWGAVAGGGGGAGGGNGGAGGTGGSNGTGTLITRFRGGSGQGGLVVSGGTAGGIGGCGGCNPFGGTGGGGGNNTAGTAGAASTGAGGGGGGGSANNSGAGGGAGEYVEFWVNSPGATSYSIGGAGAAGAGAGQNGGAGANGLIAIEEFYF